MHIKQFQDDSFDDGGDDDNNLLSPDPMYFSRDFNQLTQGYYSAGLCSGAFGWDATLQTGLIMVGVIGIFD